VARRIENLKEKNIVLDKRIDEIQALLSGVDAARQLESKAAEFARADREHPGLIQAAAGSIRDT
jgi:hypothetical protein